MRSLLLVAAATLALLPGGLRAQSILEVLEAVRIGGGWVRIPVEAGRGTLVTAALPSAGRTLEGCMEIWPGHSGRWLLRVADAYGNGRLEAEAAPAEDIPFTYVTGPMARLEVDVEWSERRDTTLLVWVGLESPSRSRDPCDPVYAGGR